MPRPAMQHNYYALVVSILRECSPERAFELLGDKRVRNDDLTHEDVLEMMRLRAEGYSLKQVGDMYGITFSSVNTRIQRAKKKMALKQEWGQLT